MKILCFALGQLQTNCYLVICLQTRKTIIIDPADDANFISEKILREKLKPIAIIATHGHFDHILAAQELQLAFNIPFFIHQKDQKILQRMSQSASWWLKREIIESPPKINKFLKGNETVRIGQKKLRIMEAPGHTPGSICLYNQEEKVLFSGDTVVEKIKQKFAGFKIYPGHGKDFTLTA